MTDGSDLSQQTDEQDEQLDEFRTLVRAAFEQALNSRKPDWEVMTSAVLKNRLLSLTRKEFSQERYGSPSFINLVRRIPDLLEIIDSQPPFRVKIKSDITEQSDLERHSEDPSRKIAIAEATRKTPPRTDWHRIRIRDDLWRSILDYSSGNTYVLDHNADIARQEEPTDTDLPKIPTASREEFRSWRQEFVQSLSEPTKTRFADELQSWINYGGSQTDPPRPDLPRPVRNQWVEFLKTKISRRLTEWFESQDKTPPDDMLQFARSHAVLPNEAIGEAVETRQLRDFIIRAVRKMTREELGAIMLPASVLLRASDERSNKGA
jgi:hypothetical protein